MSQRDLAKKIGIAQSTIARMEKNMHSMSISNFTKLLGALGYKLEIIKRYEIGFTKNLSKEFSYQAVFSANKTDAVTNAPILMVENGFPFLKTRILRKYNVDRFIKQNLDEVTFGYNITKEEEKINFSNSSKTIHNQIRGLSSVPGAYCIINDKRLKVYQSEITKQKSNTPCGTIIDIDKTGISVNTKDFIIKLTDIKLEGKKRCLVKDFINGINKEEYIGKVLK